MELGKKLALWIFSRNSSKPQKSNPHLTYVSIKFIARSHPGGGCTTKTFILEVAYCTSLSSGRKSLQMLTGYRSWVFEVNASCARPALLRRRGILKHQNTTGCRSYSPSLYVWRLKDLSELGSFFQWWSWKVFHVCCLNVLRRSRNSFCSGLMFAVRQI